MTTNSVAELTIALTIKPDDPLTIGNIIARFPAVEAVLNLANLVYDEKVYNPWEAYEYFKCILSGYVGWGSPDPNYATSRAYDVALKAMINRLGV